VKTPGPILLLIRHGETDWNAEGRLQGQRDIPINAKGRRQAARNGRALGDYLASLGRSADQFDWTASPLSRARETMEIIRAAMDLDPNAYRPDPQLKEICFGDWEGSTMQEMREIDPVGRAERKKDKWGFAPPNGESYEMLSARIRPWLLGLERDTICVAHGGITRVTRGMLEDIPGHEIPIAMIPQDRIYVWREGRAEWI